MSFIAGLFITDLVSFVFGTTMPELSLWTVAEYTTTDIVWSDTVNVTSVG